ncbi:hypothetical protein [Plantactinospora sp. ZYX-F-223]
MRERTGQVSEERRSERSRLCPDTRGTVKSWEAAGLAGTPGEAA